MPYTRCEGVAGYRVLPVITFLVFNLVYTISTGYKCIVGINIADIPIVLIVYSIKMLIVICIYNNNLL
jgi:hypothetical protein